MFGLTRWTMLITAVVVSAIFAGITVGIAQSPLPESPTPDDPSTPDPVPELTLPQLALPPVPLPENLEPLEPSPSTLEHISDILQRKKLATETGDSKMDELGQILSEMGSVLDGSPLDASLDVESVVADSGESARAVAAEMLLKTARKLEQLGPVDRSRRQLVIQMRGEAVKLLSQ